MLDTHNSIRSQHLLDLCQTQALTRTKTIRRAPVPNGCHCSSFNSLGHNQCWYQVRVKLTTALSPRFFPYRYGHWGWTPVTQSGGDPNSALAIHNRCLGPRCRFVACLVINWAIGWYSTCLIPCTRLPCYGLRIIITLSQAIAYGEVIISRRPYHHHRQQMIVCSVSLSYCVCRRPSWPPKTQPNVTSADVTLCLVFMNINSLVDTPNAQLIHYYLKTDFLIIWLNHCKVNTLNPFLNSMVF